MKLALVLTALAFGAGGAPPSPAVPHFGRVVVVVFENKERSQVLGNPAAPAFNAFARRGAVLSGYRGVTHPSLPNYLALVSGSTQGIHSDCSFCIVAARSLADTLPRAHRTWKAYAEGLPEPGYTGASFGRYAKKHVPFLYFQDVTTSPSRRRRVVPLRQLSRDLAANRLPSFSLVVPDLCHDMHDCSVATGDVWLTGFLKPLLRSKKLANSAIFVVFDETDGSTASGLIPALALGPAVVPGSRYRGSISHYGLLRTIEDAWGLPRLGRSRAAAPITGIWR